MPDLLSIDYSDSTPDISYSNYDRFARPRQITDASGQRALNYQNGQHIETAYQSGLFAGLKLSTPRYAFGRFEALELTQDGALLHNFRHYYTNAQGLDTGRLQTIGWQDTETNYTYEENSSLIHGYSLTRQNNTAYTQSKKHDLLNRLTEIATTPHALPAAVYGYAYNDLNQRTRRTRSNASYTDWAYDDLGQIDTATDRFADNSTQPGRSYDYDHDAIGNRTQTSHNGNIETYQLDADGLNQYESRDVPRSTPVHGEVNPNVVIDVTVNSEVATTAQGRFYAEADFSPQDFSYPTDADSAHYETITIEARKNGGTVNEVARYSSEAYIPPHPEAFVHDADGNLTDDGRWHYTWDAENRLIAMETLSVAYNAGAPRKKLEFGYDSLGRRFSKTVSDWNESSGLWSQASSLLYLYEGWNLIAELAAPNSPVSDLTLQVSYVWGLDLSGSPQGAGGVGGLLAVMDSTGSTSYPTYDGNGNVMGYYAAEDGTNVAEFEYGPFGELIRATGTKKDDFNFRFSTKYEDTETGLLYYGYRYYDAGQGRWLSRDPIGERGGLNVYGMVGNDAVNTWDLLGLWVNPNGIVSPEVTVGTVNGIELQHLEVLKDRLSSVKSGRGAGAIRANIRKAATTRLLGDIYDTYNTDYIDGSRNKWIYTCKYGWIDIGHYYNSAYFASKPWISDSVTYAGSVGVEIGQTLRRWYDISPIGNGPSPTGESSWTPEDLNSNYQGAHSGMRIGNVASTWKSFLKSAGAVKIVDNDVRELLEKDAGSVLDDISYTGPRLYSRESQINYHQGKYAHECLCDGDKALDQYSY